MLGRKARPLGQDLSRPGSRRRGCWRPGPSLGSGREATGGVPGEWAVVGGHTLARALCVAARFARNPNWKGGEGNAIRRCNRTCRLWANDGQRGWLLRRLPSARLLESGNRIPRIILRGRLPEAKGGSWDASLPKGIRLWARLCKETLWPRARSSRSMVDQSTE